MMIVKNIVPLAVLAALCCANTLAQDGWENVGSSQSWRAFGSPDEAENSVENTLDAFRVFDKKWNKYTEHQSIEVFSPKLLKRRLRATTANHEARRGRKLFLGAFNELIGAVQGATSAAQGVLNLFGKKTSEALVGQFTDRGFEKFNEKTTITVTSGLPTKYFEAFMKDQLTNVVKVPAKHNDAIQQIIRWGLYTQSNSWNAAENTFDIDKGGKVKNFQLFVNRNVECENMNIVLVKTDVTFNLAEDVFVISKSKATFGGAFSTTKLHWKKSKAALKSPDLQFVSEYFMNLGMNRIKQSREVAGFADTDAKGCGGTAPPKQTSPFKDEAEEVEQFDASPEILPVIRLNRNGKASPPQWADIFDKRGNILGQVCIFCTQNNRDVNEFDEIAGRKGKTVLHLNRDGKESPPQWAAILDLRGNILGKVCIFCTQNNRL